MVYIFTYTSRLGKANIKGKNELAVSIYNNFKYNIDIQ